MASYIGVSPPEQTGIVERYKYAGDGSTTAFSGADTNAKVLRYTSTNPILVFLNGVQLVEGTDFTKTSNTVVTFASAPTNGDDIEILTFGSFDLNSPSTIKCDLGLNTTDSPTFASATLTPDLAKLTINSNLGKIFEIGPRSTSDNSNRDRALLTMINDNFYTGVQLDPGGSQSWINYNNTKCFGVGQCNPQANLHVGGASIFDDNITLATNKKLQLRDSGTYINSNADGDLDIVSDGTANESIKLTSAGGIYLQADGSSTVGTIRLDAQSGVVNLYRDGTLTTSLNNEADGDVEIHSRVSNADLRIRGNDGGSDITALTFDMSAAGTATFNHDLILPNNGILQLGDAGENIVGDGTNLTISSSQNLILDTANELKLDSTVGINLLDNGTSYGLMADASGDFVIKSQQSDKNLIIKGNDGGSTVNALTFDMSEAGAATFNDNITLADDKKVIFGDAGEHIAGDGTNLAITTSNQLHLVVPGRLGINTTSPTKQVHIAATASDQPFLRIETSDGGNKRLDLSVQSSNGVIEAKQSAQCLIMDATTALISKVNGTEYMRINNSGNIGIGKTSPSQILDIAGGSIALEDGYGIRFGNGDFRVEGKDDGTNARIGFVAGNSEAMRINSSGNVGIGTTTPGLPLHLVGACARFESDTVSRAIDIDPTSGSVEMSDNTNSLHLQRNHNGNVQVGFQSSAGLHVQNCAGFGASPATGIPVVVVKDSVATDTMLVQTTESSQSAGPIISLKRNSSSPADADYLGQIKFKGENDADQETLYAKITGKIDDASDGSEDGLIEFANIKAGSNVITARLKGDAFQLLNGLRLHVDGNVGIGTTNPENMLHIAGSSGLPPRIKFTSDQFSAASCITADNGQLQFYADKDSSQGSSKIGFHVDNLERGCFLSDGSYNISGYMIFGGSQHRLLGYGESVGVGHDVYINQTGSAARNAAMGFEALCSNTTGSDLSVLGHSALKNNTTGSCNVAIGSSSLCTNNTGQLNIGIGAASLRLNTTGCAHTAIGVNALCTNTTGVNNVAIGHNSLRCNVSGSCNVGIGYMALCCTKGNSNTGVGFQVLQLNTTGTCNVAIGHRSLYCNTFGSSNTALGSFALCKNTTGYNNVAVGQTALCTNTFGQRNTAVGVQSMKVNTVGGCNVAMGFNSLTANTTGSFNTALGYQSLKDNTTGQYNVGIGYNSLLDNTVGQANVAIGYASSQENTTGNNNVAVGFSALRETTTGSNNTAIGYQALRFSVTGYQNTAVGSEALCKNTSGQSNTAVGYRALCGNTTGINNIAIGDNSLCTNTIGYQNIAVGSESMLSATTGFSNVSIGYQSLRQGTTTSCNTAIGTSAGRNNTNTENVFIGFEAGCNNGCGSNVFIGSRAGKNTAGTSMNNTIIGRSAFENGRGSYNVVLGRQSLHSTGQSQNYNTALGFQTLCKNTTSCNVAIGSQSGFNNTTGTMTAVGYQSLCSNTTGDRNTAVGHSALKANVTGSYNTSVGYQSLCKNTNGEYNVAVGDAVLFSNTTGHSNVGVGRSSLLSNTTGVANVTLGKDTLLVNTTGAFNTALGHMALKCNVSGTNNVAVGMCALFNNTCGANVAVGTTALMSNTTGTCNTALGHRALCANICGNQNTGLGYFALRANTTGLYNTGVGANALKANTTGQANTAVGYQSQNSGTTGCKNTSFGSFSSVTNTTGQNNVAVGWGALYTNKCNDNTAVGMCSLYNNTTGLRNTALGMCALKANTSGKCNVSVGYASLNANTIGACNVSVGAASLISNTTGSFNTALGFHTLNNNTTGERNVAVGHRALCDNTTGEHNVAVGGDALGSNICGNFNTAVGDCAMIANTTGNQNVAVGRQSLCNNTTGINNVAIGVSALVSNVTGQSNVAIGCAALFCNTADGNTAVGLRSLCKNTVGTANTAIGMIALQQNTTGDNNVAVGHSTLLNNTIGEHNTALGKDALRTQTTGCYNVSIGLQSLCKNVTGSNNTAVGSTALFAVTNGDYNIGIGRGAGNNITTGAGNVVIGNVAAGSATGDRQLLISGYDGSTTTTWITGDNAGNVGIGTASVQGGTARTLQIAHSTSARLLLENTGGGRKYGFFAGTDGKLGLFDYTGATQRLAIDTNGRLGIGTTSPVSLFHVASATADADGSLGSQAPQMILQGGTGNQNNRFEFGMDSSGGTAIGFLQSRNTVSGAQHLSLNPKGGNVGVGTSSPTETLEVTGDVVFNSSAGNKGLAMKPTAAGSTSILLNTFADNTSGRNWAIRNRYNAHGRFEIMRGTTNTDAPLTTVLKLDNDSSATFTGSLSKASGSFKIDHPLPSKTETHNLVHSFVEAPQADNIYRGKIDLVNGTATVNIDTNSGMSEGTFVLLNREIQVFTSNETGWTAVKGSVSGNILTITAQDNTCTDTISWLVIGERQDQHMYDTNWTDENGKVIVEPLKETEETLENA